MARYLIAGALALLLLACGAAQPDPELPRLSSSDAGSPIVLAIAPLPAPAASGDVEMPWVWRLLRREVYARLPRVERSRRGANAVLSPVIVDGPYDSVPGLGAEGRF